MVEVTPAAGLARLILRGDGAVISVATAAFGVPIPQTACRAASAPPRAALWLGPDEFLLLLPEADRLFTMAAITAALAAHPHALIDIGDRQLALRIAGPHAATLLNTGCPLDLHPDAFPTNTCTRTLLGRAEIVLWRTGAQEFHLEAARSYLPYVRDFLDEAMLCLL